MSSRKSPVPHLTFFMAVTLFLVVGFIVSINGIGLNLSGTAFAQQQLSANFTSVEQQQLMDGISFEIDNVTFSHHMASVNGIQLHYVILLSIIYLIKTTNMALIESDIGHHLT